jgi:two-component system CheB/CheR fusion protein
MTICIDISDRKRADEQQTLLLREMSHRVKNLFAITSSVVALSARTAKTPEDMAGDVQARLRALTQAHALTRPGLIGSQAKASEETTFHTLVRTIFSPYAGEEGAVDKRLIIVGPDLPIAGSAITNLALVFHEFATNAAKYGALSSTGGSVKIDYTIDRGCLSLIWSENNGPPVNGTPKENGFGALLTRRIVTGQFNGRFNEEWKPEGLTIHLSIPIDLLTL